MALLCSGVSVVDAAPEAVPSTSPVPTVALPVERVRLANGLEVIYDLDRRTPVVTVNLWYHVGSKNEAPGRNGFAHLFEHLMFQGSKHVPEDTYFRTLEQAGGTSINGTTGNDRTNYYETVPSNQLALALWLESDRMGFLLDHVNEATFVSQREVVKNEHRQNYSNAPYGFVIRFVREALFPDDHPYHTIAIGKPEDLDAASLEDVRRFFAVNYVPNNASLVISGDFDRTRAGVLVEQYFGSLPRGADVPRKPREVVRLAGETAIDIEAGVDLAQVTINWRTPAAYTPGHAELELAARLLSHGTSSRLYKRLVYELQIAESVSATQYSLELASAFEIEATAREGHTAAELLGVIDEELTKLREHGVSDAELARAKATSAAEAIFDVERSSTRANRINKYAHYTGDPSFFAEDLARTARATPAGVQAALAAWLTAHDRVVALVTPQQDAPVCGRVVATRRGAP
ncbi:MAG: pitrilysin family protein [Polyangiales bacterium]